MVAVSTHIMLGIIAIYIIKYTPFIKAKELWRTQIKRYLLKLAYSIFGIWFSSEFNIFYEKDCMNLQNSNVLTISNHVSDFDWMFVSFVLNRFDLFQRVIISMRENIKKVPILGLILQTFNSIFLIRTTGTNNEKISDEELHERIEKNNQRIRIALKKFDDCGIKPNPLIFVEGTYICKEKYIKWLCTYFKTKFEIDKKVVDEKKTDDVDAILNDTIKKIVNEDSGNFQDNKKNFIENVYSKLKEVLELKENTSAKEIYFPFYTLNPKHHGLVEILLNSTQEYDAIVNCTLIPTPYNRFIWDRYKIDNIFLHGAESYVADVFVDKITLSKDIKELITEIKGTETISLKTSKPKSSEEIKDLKKKLEEKIFELLDQKFREKEDLIESYLRSANNNNKFDGGRMVEKFRLSRLYEKVFFLATGLMVPVFISYFIGFPLVYHIYDYIRESSGVFSKYSIFS